MSYTRITRTVKRLIAATEIVVISLFTRLYVILTYKSSLLNDDFMKE